MTQPTSPALLDPAHLVTICHELRQPLHAYRIFSDRLASQLDGEPLALATQMNTAIRSLTIMSETLHEMAHALNTNGDPLLQTVQLHVLLAELERSFATPRLTVRQVKLTTVTNSSRLAIILKHLVRNALQHGTGRCLISCRRHAGKIRLDIIDQGPGLPETLTPHRTSPGQNALAQPTPGLGLGLHIVRQLAVQLGLHLDIVSRPGHGTRATLYFPDLTRSTMLVNQNNSQPQWLTGKTIQLANISNSQLLSELETLLTSWGAQTTLATSQPGAHNPDLIIADSLPTASSSGKQCTTLILGATPAASPPPGIRYLPPPHTPPRLRMAITNILGSNF